jgi:hypothetical protein
MSSLPSADMVNAGTLVFEAFYGGTPPDPELSVLAQFAQNQYAYGQQIGVADPLIYAYQALGVTLASTGPQFLNTFAPSSPGHPASPAGDTQFVVDAYASVFSHAASQAQTQVFVAQLHFFENLYTSAGVYGDASNVDLLARGAVYGQMLGVEHEINPAVVIGLNISTPHV